MHTYISGGSKEPSPTADPNQKFDLFLTFFCFGNYLKNRWSFYVLRSTQIVLSIGLICLAFVLSSVLLSPQDGIRCVLE